MTDSQFIWWVFIGGTLGTGIIYFSLRELIRAIIKELRRNPFDDNDT